MASHELTEDELSQPDFQTVRASTSGNYHTCLHLAVRHAIDATAAITAAVSVSPIMMILDRSVPDQLEPASQQLTPFRAVIERAAKQRTISTSIQSSIKSLFCRPHQILISKPFGAMLLLYAGTYFTANTIDTISSFQQGLPPQTTTSTTTKFIAVTTMNIGLALNKDSIYARSFGTVASRSRLLPPISYIPFLIRDGITLYATFNLPPLVAPTLPNSLEAYLSKLTAAQLILPAASQFITTPSHLLGLDLYYRNGSMGISERLRVIRSGWFYTSLARACRIVPAYGLGGVMNNESRRFMMNCSAGY